MRLEGSLLHPIVHVALTNVLPEQHHMEPSIIEFSNTSLIVPPLPGGPGVLDVVVPFDTQVASVALRSGRTVSEASGKAGALGIVTRTSLEASFASIGGTGSIAQTSKNALYTKKSGALNLTHKVFDVPSYLYISMTDAWLVATGPSTRVLRMQWTNYSSGNLTLNVWGTVGVLG